MINVCQPGKDLKCSGYCLYSSSTILVLSIGNGVFGFTLDPLVGEFILSHRRACWGPVIRAHAVSPAWCWGG